MSTTLLLVKWFVDYNARYYLDVKIFIDDEAKEANV
jgi:hypothetical protein